MATTLSTLSLCELISKAWAAFGAVFNLVNAAAQEFHNYNPATDIFCHSNRLFWDVTCPGIVDGFGGVMCTGTNYVVRSRALLKARPTNAFSCRGQSTMQIASHCWLTRARIRQPSLSG